MNSSDRRVVITGIGILTGNAQGREDFTRALREGRPGYRDVTLFDTGPFLVKTAGEISAFDPKLYLGPKGLRNLDRSTTLLISAGKLALKDCGFSITEENTDDVGVSTGTTLGSVKSISDFDEVTLREGPQATNPALFPNTVINAPSSQVSIWCNIQGFNTTISTGFTASMDAMRYAYDFIQWGRAKVVLTGGVEEMCLQTFLGFYALKLLSGSRPGEAFINCPFDRRRNGITFGEGACFLVFEEYEHALARGARILAEVASFGYQFDPFRLNKYNPKATGLKAALSLALDEAGLGAKDIDYISANANSTVPADKIEALAIREVLGSRGAKIPVSSVKSMIGECYSVSGAFGAAAAVCALTDEFLPPNINYQEKDPDCDLQIVANRSETARLKNVLVVNFGPGASHCLILRKPQTDDFSATPPLR